MTLYYICLLYTSEIYLNDPEKVAPEKLKTIVRYAIDEEGAVSYTHLDVYKRQVLVW